MKARGRKDEVKKQDEGNEQHPSSRELRLARSFSQSPAYPEIHAWSLCPLDGKNIPDLSMVHLARHSENLRVMLFHDLDDFVESVEEEFVEKGGQILGLLDYLSPHHGIPTRGLGGVVENVLV